MTSVNQKTIQRPGFSPQYFERSEKLLRTALERTPAYEGWKYRDPGPGVPVDRRYSSLPVTTKSLLREKTWKGFIPAGSDPEAALASGEIELAFTSGTTEERVVNAWYQPWWDESEKMSWEYNGHTRSLGLGNHREAILTSPLNTGVRSDDRDVSMDMRTAGRFLYLNEKSSPLLWTDALMERMLAELESFRPHVLEANPSYLARLAHYISRKKLSVHQPPMILYTYENPLPSHRRRIQTAFPGPAASSYGATETAYVFMECEEGCLHQNELSCRVDFQPLKPGHGGPDVGRIFVSSFSNPWRSMLRFDIGDLIRLKSPGSCACGRDGGYIAASIEGRTANLTFTTRGTAITPLQVDRALESVEGLLGYQVKQSDLRSYEVLIEPEDDVDKKDLASRAAQAAGGLYGDGTEVAVHVVDAIPVERSGKYRYTRTAFPYDIDSLFDREASS